ncbi:DUF1254 domain-containing protein (plasmid) [Streptomyces sp. NBC_01717]|uniref:DUF1254 domain-containing protein n=1 Tax=Streptomyces sp. NBC_01717 TaxID=2975918 RepID=UPI002E3514F6|nr:DUF1254 domain-containing protein [Streptomyces sp. NBC_01717]
MSTFSNDLRLLSREAYHYLYPLVTMDVTRLQMINAEPGTRLGFGPPNTFHHLRAFPAAEMRAVVRPNFDTLYSIAWLDLTAGPVVLHTPDTADRYYLLQMLDMWTDVFATPGKRTTGTEARDFVVVGPGYAGELPAGLPVIAAPTPWVWIVGRTQTNGPADYPAVHAVQAGYRITPPVHSAEHRIDPAHDTTTEPLHLVNGMDAVEFFTRAAEALRISPPHASDFSVLARIARLGIAPGEDFDPGRFDAAQLAEIQAGADDARRAILGALPTLGQQVNGWTTFTDSMGVYGNNYFFRAVIAAIGLAANEAEDSVYPVLVADADGEPLDGKHDYVLHFDADQLPPVHAFWSVTLYDEEGFQAANELDRFALGDRDPLVFNADGSLDIHVQHTEPGLEHRPNWLPAPRGPLGITMRLFVPKPEVLDGRWSPPAVRRI